MSIESFEKTLVLDAPPDARPPARSERLGTLTVLIGSQVGASHSLGTSTVIGRGPEAQLSIDDDGISRRHCRIVAEHGEYDIEDLGSTNGTFVEQVRIRSRVKLFEGARILLGTTLLRFGMQDSLEQENARRMYEMAVRDGLTSAYNRRYFDERLESEFAFAARHGTALCVLLIDIDHFKRINDTHGHQAGDEVLRRLSAALRAGVRIEDVVARYGGEEFAVIARGIDPAGARLFAERIRSMIERDRVAWQGRIIPVTASIGVAHNHTGTPVVRAERLLAAADKALYDAKRAGRNRVVVASSPGRYALAGSVEPDRTPNRNLGRIENPRSDGREAPAAVPRHKPVPDTRDLWPERDDG